MHFINQMLGLIFYLLAFIGLITVLIFALLIYSFGINSPLQDVDPKGKPVLVTGKNELCVK